MQGLDPRPGSPGQLALIGAVLVGLAWIGLVGLAARPFLYVGFFLVGVALITWLLRPRRRTVYWRGQQIDMTGSLRWWERLYYLIYRG